MVKKLLTILVLMSAVCLMSQQAPAQTNNPQSTINNPKYTSFAYVSRNYIITAEPAGARSFMINVINLSDYVIVVQPQDFIYRGESGRCYIGQVFET